MEGKSSKNKGGMDTSLLWKIGIPVVLLIVLVILLLQACANQKFTVTFDSNGGSKVESITVKKGETITKPEDPTKENYNFVGWYLDDEPFDFTSKITKNITLKAKWSSESEETPGLVLNLDTLTLKPGEKTTLVATLGPDNEKVELIWSSSDESIATVDENGVVTALKEGKVTITAKTKDGKYTATCELTVSEEKIAVTGVQFSKKTLSMYTGSTLRLANYVTINPTNASNKGLIWSSSNTSVASVNSRGVVTAKKAGTVTITVKTADGEFTATVTITITNPPRVDVTSVTLDKAKLDLTIGSSAKVNATVNPSNATDKTVTWTSSNPSVVTVDKNGNIKAVGIGSAKVTATAGGKSASVEVTVKPIEVSKVTVSPTSLNMTVGESKKAEATVEPANATDKTLTWESSDSSVVSVDQQGNIKALKSSNGKTITITVKSKNGKTATISVIVKSQDEINMEKAKALMNPKTIQKANDNVNYTATGCTIVANNANTSDNKTTLVSGVATKVYRPVSATTVKVTYTITCGSLKETKDVTHTIPASTYTYTTTKGIVTIINVNPNATDYYFTDDGRLDYVNGVGVQYGRHQQGHIYNMLFNSDPNTTYAVKSAQ